ncbi:MULTISPECIES: carbohydrate kinase family protein [Emticicia]|uniref:carbohydrate kinase family protein n=1 Tax=Emticicia TaxID=312278 RepID=UPI0007D8AEE2|nr:MULTISPECIES: carbohydrate kinase [Emticicia]
MTRKYALLAVGELLADFIGTELAEDISTTDRFQRFQGGSPSNLAANMARLGNPTAIVSCVGKDSLGKYLIAKVKETGVDITHVAIDEQEPSSIVVVARSKGTPDFIAYRTADRMIRPEHISDELLSESAVFHTTCFALSQNPAQSTIVEAAQRANKLGCQLSIDLNYAPSIWPDRNEAMQIIAAYLKNGALAKMSEDDAERLYGRVIEPQEAIADLHRMGASVVCFTMGGRGSIISYENGKQKLEMAARKIEVVDATGAGDSYWSGFLTAFLEGKDIETCANAGANIAVLKLTTMGPLPAKVNREILYTPTP